MKERRVKSATGGISNHQDVSLRVVLFDLSWSKGGNTRGWHPIIADPCVMGRVGGLDSFFDMFAYEELMRSL